MSGVKRKILTIGEKMGIIRELEIGASRTSICKKYELPTSTVSTIWKNRNIIINAYEKNKATSKKLRNCEKNDLEDALLTWIRMQSINQISGPILKIQAEKMAKELGYTNFVCNNGWLDRFKNRNNIFYGRKSNIFNKIIPDIWSGMRTVIQESNNLQSAAQVEIINNVSNEIIENKFEIKKEVPEEEERIVCDVDIHLYSDHQIVDNDEDNKEKINVVQVTSCAEAQSALKTLSMFYETNNIDPIFHDYINKMNEIVDKYHLECNSNHATITDYYK